ncbi:MAG: 50S ribosomal protein L4 [Patescibacteria group bacterium]
MKRETGKIKVSVWNSEGKIVKEIELPENIFGLELNNDLIHQVVYVLRSNQRQPTAHAKTRAEVSGGGKKPWRQKGLGRARHGSIRSPIWVGGGVAHGPTKEKSYQKKINKKMKQKALFQILSSKLKQNRFLILEGEIKLKEPKTKLAEAYLKNILKSGSRAKKTLLVNDFESPTQARAFYNLNYLKVIPVKNINILDLVNFPYLLMPESGLENLIKHLTK